MMRPPSCVAPGVMGAILFSNAFLAAQSPGVVPSRDYIVQKIAEIRRISTPEGIEALEQVEIGGTKQWISIRGLNRANPVLLMIHGGPGSPTMAASWAFQTPWEDYFTVVQWDQRGVGKNYASSDHKALASTMTVERMVTDGEEMVAYLRKRLQKDKIVVLGWSWGSTIGRHLAQRRPEWLYAYVGVGQTSSGSEKRIYERTLELAKQAANEEAVRELQSVSPYPHVGEGSGRGKGQVVRKWARVFNGGWYGRTDLELYFSLPGWGPEYTQADLDNLAPSSRWTGETLARDFGRDRPSSDVTQNTGEFKVPIFILMGRYDLHTAYEPAKQYFDQIRAPLKRFITFERSAHFPMFEEPGRFFVTLVSEVLPLTEPSVSFKPLP